MTKAEKKLAYDKKLRSPLDEYSQVLVADADNVRSNQLQDINAGITLAFQDFKCEAHLRVPIIKRRDHPSVSKL